MIKLQGTPKKILDKHIKRFYNNNKNATFNDIPLNVFMEAMNDFANHQTAELLKACNSIIIGYNTNTIDELRISILKEAIKNAPQPEPMVTEIRNCSTCKHNNQDPINHRMCRYCGDFENYEPR